MKTFTVWLVIQIGISGQPMIKVEDLEQPDIETCLAKSAEILKKASNVTQGYDEFFVTCSITREPADPA